MNKQKRSSYSIREREKKNLIQTKREWKLLLFSSFTIPASFSAENEAEFKSLSWFDFFFSLKPK